MRSESEMTPRYAFMTGFLTKMSVLVVVSRAIRDNFSEDLLKHPQEAIMHTVVSSSHQVGTGIFHVTLTSKAKTAKHVAFNLTELLQDWI